MRLSPLHLAAASLLLVACDRGPSPSEGAAPLTATPAPAPEAAPAPAPAFDPAAPVVGGVRFEAPAPLRYRPASSPMRSAEYLVEGRGEEALLVVHHFPGMGGSPEANIRRWLGQVSQPDGRDSAEVATLDKATVQGLEITRVDVTGSYAGMTPAGGAAPAEAGQRLLGAVVVGPEGPVFFKLVGSVAAVGEAAEAFRQLLESCAPAQS